MVPPESIQRPGAVPWAFEHGHAWRYQRLAPVEVGHRNAARLEARADAGR